MVSKKKIVLVTISVLYQEHLYKVSWENIKQLWSIRGTFPKMNSNEHQEHLYKISWGHIKRFSKSRRNIPK